MVMHEFLRDGKKKLSKCLKKKKNLKVNIFLGEFDCLEDDEYQKLPYPDEFFFLPACNTPLFKGLTYKEEWLDIFKQTLR